MISVMQGRTSAGHLGQSLSVFKKNNGEIGIWVGEPMSEQGTFFSTFVAA